MKLSRLIWIVLLFIPAGSIRAQTTEVEGDYLYRVQMLRANPGEFRAFIEQAKIHFDRIESLGDERPMWMRHSQGDKWDFLILYPMGEWSEYHAPERTRLRASLLSDGSSFSARIAWTEDLFVRGVGPDLLRPAMDGAGFYHIEMFNALPGKAEELLGQRRMENEFLQALNRPVNFIFVREAGSAVDSFTLGCYRDLKHFAESGDLSPDAEEAAARYAGFGSVSNISPYLRSLIAEHHDTLAVAIQ